MNKEQMIPGPKGHWLLGSLPELKKDTLGLLYDGFKTYGDRVRFRFGPLACYLFVHPGDVQYIFQDNAGNFGKNTRGYETIRKVLGQGLLTSQGPLWRRQRSSALRVLTQENVLRHAPVMVQTAQSVLKEWREDCKEGQDLDLFNAMGYLVFRMFDAGLFHAYLTKEEIEYSIDADRFLSHYLSSRTRSPLNMPLWIPTKDNQRYHSIMRRIRFISKRLMQDTKNMDTSEQSLFARILKDNTNEDGTLDETMIHDEIRTFFVSGHETVALSMSWFLLQLDQHPEIKEAVEQEIERVFSGELPTIEDLSKLEYTEQIILETLRLFPPGWQIVRSTIEKDVIGGVSIPADTVVVSSPYMTHRHPDFWEDPEKFQPERFVKEKRKKINSFAYFPFGRGPHQCVGQHLAMIEMKFMIVLLMQQFRWTVHPHCGNRVKALFTLSPQENLYIQLRRK